MTQDEKQAVVETTDEQAGPASEEAGAQGTERDPLDEFLAEYDQGVAQTQQTQPQPEQTSTETTDTDALKEIRELRRDLAIKEDEKDIATLVNQIHQDTGLGTPRLIEGFANAMAKEKPELNDIFNNRHKDPGAWARASKALASEWAKEFKSMPDANVTEDRMAVTAAVRGASKKAPDAGDDIDYSRVPLMSDAEFEAWAKSLPKGQPPG